MSAEQIVSMGHGNRNSYLLFSTYQFQMGTIGVQYWGIAGMTFFVNSFEKEKKVEKTIPTLAIN